MLKNMRFQLRISEELLGHCKKNSENASLFIREAIREKIENNNLVDTSKELIEIRARTPYTFYAALLDVIDGDTLYIEADLGFFVTMKTKIRLIGINTPELQSEEGKKAKEFVENELKEAHLLIETRKKEKYGRFLAYVYYHHEYKDFDDLIRYGFILNDELVKSNFAEKY